MKNIFYSFLIICIIFERHFFQTDIFYIDETKKAEEPNGTFASPFPSLNFALNNQNSNNVIFLIKSSELTIPSLNLSSLNFSLRLVFFDFF